MDLVAGYAFVRPINVIAEMLGAPHTDRDQIRAWWAALAHGLGYRWEIAARRHTFSTT